MHLLVTRPLPDGERTAQALRERGHRVTLAPVLQFEVIEVAVGDGPYAAVVMTSANAARAIAQHPRLASLTVLPAFTVGAHTAAAARRIGFARVTSADGALPDLARLIAATLPPGRLLYLAAEQRAGDFDSMLAADGFHLDTAVAYRMVANSALAQDLRAALATRPDGVLHYSSRSAQMFLAGAEAAGVLDAVRTLTHYCLSADVAAPLRDVRAGTVKIAAQPNEGAMMALL